MQHHFEVEIAEKYGVNAAIILENMRFWLAKNEANETNFHDGRCWTYNSIKAFETLFPYMSSSSISRTLKKLEEENLIITGNYNKVAYDRTKWYAFTDKARQLFKMTDSISHFDQMESAEMQNGFSDLTEPIPDRNPDRKPSKNIGEKRKRFTAPSLEEVRAYCIERNNSVDPQRFIDYYESKGWMIGKNKMKDWKAAVRTWENNGFSSPKSNAQRQAANAYLEANKDNGWGDWDWNN